MGRVLLVIEDDPMIQRLAHMMRPTKGDIELDLHTSGVDLPLPAQCPWDGALVDWMLPGENGIDVAIRLREKYPEMPIAIWSAAPWPAKEEAQSSGFMFLAKPDGFREIFKIFGWGDDA